MTSPTTTAPNPLIAPRQDTTQWYTGIYIASLDSPGNPKWVMAAQSSAVYLPSGHLLYVRDNTLFAQAIRCLALLL